MDSAAAKQLETAKTIKELFKKFEARGKTRQTRGAANTHLTRLDVNYQNFTDNHAKILKLQSANPEHTYFSSAIVSEVEDAYWDVRGSFADFLLDLEAAEAAKKPVEKSSPPVAQTSQISLQHLPKMDLPVFSGHLNDWENFRDLFKSIVHFCDRITPVDKLNFLRTHVLGKALEIVKQYTITEANYTEAWTALKGYYENPRRLVNSHLTAFYAVKPMKNESAEALSQLLTGIFGPIGALKSLGRPTDQWSDLIFIRSVDLRSTLYVNGKNH